MANKANTETVRLRPNTIDENCAILLEIQSRKLVDSRKQDDLNALFDRINAECASKSLQERRKALASSDKLCEISKPAHYGPQPGVSSGKRWSNRMDCAKDCIHELFDKNVHDGPYGAVSICTSDLNDQNDVDLGDLLTFTSRVYSATDQAKDSLILNYKNQVPLRLVRSYNLSCDFAPKTGYRYDGLYMVVDYWVGVSCDQSKHRKFALVRVTDQEAPPWNDTESRNVIKKTVTLSRSIKRPRSIYSPKLEPQQLIHARIHKHPKEKRVDAIEFRRVFNENIDGSIVSSSKVVTYQDPKHQNPYLITCAPNFGSANLSTEANLHKSAEQYKERDIKETEADTIDEMFKQQVLSSQQNMQDEAMSIIVEIPYIDDTSLSNSSGDEYPDECVKKVTWADTSDPISCEVDEADSQNGNDIQASGSDLDTISPIELKGCEVLKFNSMMQASPLKTYSNKSASKNPQQVVRNHSNSSTSQTSKAIPSQSNPFHDVAKQNDSLYSIDSLAPDKLVSVVFKDKHHPMAKLIVGNMIGLENQESEILSAYHELSSNHSAQESSKKSKENKLRSKFLLKNRARKNGILSNKHRREIANLMIDAKFDTARGSRVSRLRTSRIRIHKSESLQRKLVVSRRIPSSSKIINKDIRSSIRTVQTMKADDKRIDEMPGTKRPKMVSKAIQCSSLVMPSVDQSTQFDDSLPRVSHQDKRMKSNCTDAEEIEAECSKTKKMKGTTAKFSDHSHSANFERSAFAPVNTLDSSKRIAQLRSIGFKPIGTCSPIEYDSPGTESPRTRVDEEYSKYTSEDSDVVSYMHEHLHFEDIEDEDVTADRKRNESNKKAESQSLDDLFSKPVESLTERDFDEPWHGWKRVSVNGKSYWTGY